MRDSNLNSQEEPHTSDQDVKSHQIIEEYEGLFKTLQAQLTHCQNEQDTLRSNMEAVVLENQSLSEQLHSEISKNSTSEEFVKSLNNNIQMQLDAAIQEKESAIDMWQTSLKLVSALENELKDYRDNTHLTSALEKVNEVRSEYSRAISLLEDKLAAATLRLVKDKAAREIAEERTKQLENDLQLLTERYEKRCSDVEEALLGKQNALIKVEELEKSLSAALTEANEAKLACSELEAALERSLGRLEVTLTREAEACEKVDEALQIVDVSLIERDNALQQATQASDDAKQLRATINELITEAGTEVQAEAEKIKEQYNNRIKTVLLDMRHLHTENKAKGAQIQKLRSDLSTMESEMQRLRHDLDSAYRDRPSLSALDRKLDGFFRTQELASGEFIRTDLENEQLRAEVIKLFQSNELEQRQFLLERHALEEQINVLQGEAKNSSAILSELSTQNESLTTTLKQKDHELALLKENISNLSHRPTCDKRCTCGVESKMSDQFRAWEESNKICQELQNQLDSQRNLTNKWKSEVNLIASRFQSRLRELQSEVSVLRRDNRDLYNQLQTAKYQLKSYQPQVSNMPVFSLFSSSG